VLRSRANEQTLQKTDGRNALAPRFDEAGKLPSHATYDYFQTDLRAAGRGSHRPGVDALLIEISQDLLQTKAAVNGCKLTKESYLRL
jgi:5-methyltetrahydrofolate--homocysteine methyltransferase